MKRTLRNPRVLGGFKISPSRSILYGKTQQFVLRLPTPQKKIISCLNTWQLQISKRTQLRISATLPLDTLLSATLLSDNLLSATLLSATLFLGKQIYTSLHYNTCRRTNLSCSLTGLDWHWSSSLANAMIEKFFPSAISTNSKGLCA